MALYHLVPVDTWNASKSSGQPYFPSTYETDGFIHLTKEPRFLLGVANHFYKSSTGEWVTLELDPSKLTAKVIFEPAAPVGTTAALKHEDAPLFPHLYGTIDFGAVVRELKVRRGEGGEFLDIEGLEGAEGAVAGH